MNCYKKYISLVIYLCSVTNLLRLVSLGPITSLGVLTIAFAVITWFMVFCRATIPKEIFSAFWLILFIVLAFISWVWFLPTGSVPIVSSIQNLSVYVGFVGFLVLSIIQSNLTYDLPEYITKTLPRATHMSVGLYWLSILLSGPGSNLIMGARAFVLYAIIGVAWFLAGWRYKSPGGLLWSAITIAAIALSFSRTALLIALILFPLSQISLTSVKSLLRLGLTLTLIVTISYLAFNYVEPIRSRFTDVGDNASVGGVQINTSGRGEAWPVAYASAMDSPWIGKGPGSVGAILAVRVGPAFSHPHNDYLRIFHDFGLSGLSLWLLGYLGLMGKTWQNWQWSDRHDRDNAAIHLASFLALVAVALAMLSDNIIVYIFSMAPLGLLVGASLGSASHRKKVIKSTRKFPVLSSSSKRIPINP